MDKSADEEYDYSAGEDNPRSVFSVFTAMRPVDFARERAAMCASDILDNTAGLDSLLFTLYGHQANEIDVHQTLKWARHLRDRMQRCHLLLIKHDLAGHCADEIEAMSEIELAALSERLPPLPEDVIFGFEKPRLFRCPNPYKPGESVTKAMSIVVPFDPADMPFHSPRNDVNFTGYTGYLRLADQERVYADAPPADARFDAQAEIASLRRKRQLWLPSLVNELDAVFEGNTVTVENHLRLAIARAVEGGATTVPKGIQREAGAAGVGRRTLRSVRTIELSPDAPPVVPRRGEPTGRTIGWEFGVGRDWRYVTDEHGNQVKEFGHWRRYRDGDGNVTNEVWVRRYTKGKGKPRKPDTDAVLVARDPQTPRTVRLRSGDIERLAQAMPDDFPMGPWYRERYHPSYTLRPCCLCHQAIESGHRLFYQLVAASGTWEDATLHPTCAQTLERVRFPGLDLIHGALD